MALHKHLDFSDTRYYTHHYIVNKLQGILTFDPLLDPQEWPIPLLPSIGLYIASAVGPAQTCPVVAVLAAIVFAKLLLIKYMNTHDGATDVPVNKLTNSILNGSQLIVLKSPFIHNKISLWLCFLLLSFFLYFISKFVLFLTPYSITMFFM